MHSFAPECLLCLPEELGSKVASTMALILRTTRDNEIFFFELLFMGSIETSKILVLKLKDDLCGYWWMAPISRATSKHTVEVLRRFNGTLSAPDVWVSHQVDRFTNYTGTVCVDTDHIDYRPPTHFGIYSLVE